MKTILITLLILFFSSCAGFSPMQYTGIKVVLVGVGNKSRFNPFESRMMQENMFLYKAKDDTTRVFDLDYPLDGSTEIGSVHIMSVKR